MGLLFKCRFMRCYYRIMDVNLCNAENDDIAAISTPLGSGGIAIIRMSGNSVINIADEIFKPFSGSNSLKHTPGYTLTLGWINDKCGRPIDQVLLSIMRAPRSFTGENVVEINCHGGLLVANRCLQRVLETGVRIAEPGEFSKRAFLNGRLDASQAEAIVEIINAKSYKALDLAVKQLEGLNGRYIDEIIAMLLEVNAQIAASVDFPEEVGEPDYSDLDNSVRNQINIIDKMLAAGKRAEIYSAGVSMVICGKPNVGKSTLLNTLLKKDRAIVTDIPGTTRDTIEEMIIIKDIPIKIIDTAGIRETIDLVEQMGVEKSKDAINLADLLLFMLDAASGIDDDDRAILHMIKDYQPLVVINKCDLTERNLALSSESIYVDLKELGIIEISAREDQGINQLEDIIVARILGKTDDGMSMDIMVNHRQKEALMAAKNHLLGFLDARLNDIPLDCLSIDINLACDSLSIIKGKDLRSAAIDKIFEDFCIGK